MLHMRKKMVLYLMEVITLRREYMKKGHSIIEVALLLCFIVGISFAAITIYNNQKTDLAYMSKPTVPVNIKTTTGVNALKEPVGNPRYNKIETAGTNALTYLGLTPEAYDAAMAKVTYAQLKSSATGSEDNNIFTLANKLKRDLGLQCADVSPEKVTAKTLSVFSEILNAAVALPDSSPYKPTANAFIAQVKSLLGIS